MKRTIALLLAALFSVSLMSGCGGTKKDEGLQQIIHEKKISDEEDDSFQKLWIDSLKKEGYTVKDVTPDKSNYHAYAVSLESKTWRCYIWRRQNLKKYTIETSSYSPGTEGYTIEVPDGEGSWKLPLYFGNGSKFFMAILSQSGDSEDHLIEMFQSLAL